MSKKIKTLVMALVLATMTSMTAFADSNNSVVSTGNKADVTWADYVNSVNAGGNKTITLTPVGDGTSVYESKLGRSTISVNNIVSSAMQDGKPMLFAKGPVALHFNNDETTVGRYITKYNPLNCRVSGGKLVGVSPEMDSMGYFQRTDVNKVILRDYSIASDFKKDNTITLTEPGYYTVTVDTHNGDLNGCTIYVGSSAEELNLVEPKVENAVATSLNVTAIDKTTSLPAYNINGESYIRAKDLAYILNKTTRQFDATVNNIITYRGYAPNGSELKALPSGNAVATPYKEKMMLNNKNMQPSMYTINNEQFISLSDMKFFLNLNLSVNGNAVTVNDIAKSDVIPTDSDGRIKVEQVCLDGRYYETYERVGFNTGYNTINMRDLTVEQIIDELKRFDTKVIRTNGNLPAELAAALKGQYEIKSSVIRSDAELKEILDKCK